MIAFTGFFTVFVAIALFLLVAISKSAYLVKQAEVIVIERFGKFHCILRSGLHFVVPFMDQPRKVLWTFIKEDSRGKYYNRYSSYIERLDLREAVYDFPKQNVITKDNVTMEINALLYSQITDPKASIYEVANLPQAIEKLTQTTLRNVVGSLDLDETLISRDKINEKLREILDDATDKWGVKVNRVELQEVNPPAEIRVAMEKQMRAERGRRAVILEAEGSKQSDILKAEGSKQADILEAEGERQAKITRAQGEAEARITVANAEAEAIDVVRKSTPGADPLPYLLALNYIKVLPEMTKGKDNKMIILPYESSALMGSLATIKKMFKET
jgi:regulator of protease activity HflC (stomatin/prohibitin superfamily)